MNHLNQIVKQLLCPHTKKNNMSSLKDKMRCKDHLMQSFNFNTTTISMNVCFNYSDSCNDSKRIHQ
jgi:hypothetical protein